MHDGVNSCWGAIFPLPTNSTLFLPSLCLSVINAFDCRELDCLINEVNILHQLPACRYLITLLGLCTTPGHYAIVMEYIEGDNLHDVLINDKDRHAEIAVWEKRLAMGLEIAEGMDFLHSQDPAIIHRDLKSANVLVNSRYHCKVNYHSVTNAFVSIVLLSTCRLLTLASPKFSRSPYSLLWILLVKNQRQELCLFLHLKCLMEI